MWFKISCFSSRWWSNICETISRLILLDGVDVFKELLHLLWILRLAVFLNVLSVTVRSVEVGRIVGVDLTVFSVKPIVLLIYDVDVKFRKEQFTLKFWLYVLIFVFIMLSTSSRLQLGGRIANSLNAVCIVIHVIHFYDIRFDWCNHI